MFWKKNKKEEDTQKCEINSLNRRLKEFSDELVSVKRHKTDSELRYNLQIAELRAEISLQQAAHGTQEARLAESYEESLTRMRKDIREGFKKEIESTKTDNTRLVKANAELSGKYDGVLLINKNMQATIDGQNATIKALLGKLPDVSAKISSGEQNVNVCSN